MPVIATSEIKATDPYVFVPAALTGTATAVSASASGVRVWITPFPIRLLSMTVYTGAGAITANTTFTAAYGTATGGVAALGTTLGSALNPPVVSSANVLPVDANTDDVVGPVIPAGSAIGLNIPAVASNTTVIIGVGFRYRPA
jgi:hypothetical protein